MRTLLLDPTTLTPLEIGARLIAMLAFPGPGEVQWRNAAADAWCAHFLFHDDRADRSGMASMRARFPRYERLDQRAVKTSLRKTRRLFRDRMAAARVARGFLQEAVTGNPAVLPDEMKRLSINELCRYVLRDTGQSDPENVEKRIWRPSRPVIHLASAFDVVGQSAFPVPDMPYPLDDLELHRLIVEAAALHAAMILADPCFGVKPDMLVHVRWKE